MYINNLYTHLLNGVSTESDPWIDQSFKKPMVLNGNDAFLFNAFGLDGDNHELRKRIALFLCYMTRATHYWPKVCEIDGRYPMFQKSQYSTIKCLEAVDKEVFHAIIDAGIQKMRTNSLMDKYWDSINPTPTYPKADILIDFYNSSNMKSVGAMAYIFLLSKVK